MNKTAFTMVEERLMHSVLPLLLLGLTTAALPGQTSARTGPRAHLRIPTVLVLGDSLSAGYGLRRSEAYPELLSEKAAAVGRQIQVVNAGVSGDTTAGGLRRLHRLLARHIDVLVVELGINDFFRGMPVSEVESNLQSIIDQARACYPAIRVVIAGMQLPRSSNGDNLTAFGALYVELAKRNQAELVPFLLDGVVGNPELNLPDLIHPNARGQEILADNVWPALENVLERISTSEPSPND